MIPDFITPNAFSPNGDGINDIFQPQIVGQLRVTKFNAYDRWGQLVYESKDGKVLWDGTYNGAAQATGTYYWIINFTDTYRNKPMIKSGYVAITK